MILGLLGAIESIVSPISSSGEIGAQVLPRSVVLYTWFPGEVYRIFGLTGSITYGVIHGPLGSAPLICSKYPPPSIDL
jgi:hypothetical protein